MIKIAIYQDGKVLSDFAQEDDRGEITIGRAPGCLIRLEDPSISRLHALIRKSEGDWIVERRANFGVIQVNGQEVENATLYGGEEIQIGSFSLRVDIPSTSRPYPNTHKIAREALGSDDRTRAVTAGSAVGLLRFEPGAANVSEFQLSQAVTVLGRASNCDVVLLDKKASRKHIEIRRDGLSFYLRDLESANGVLVNDKKVREQVELVPGDTMQIGDSRFQFSVENKEFFARQGEFLPVPSDEALPTGEFSQAQEIVASTEVGASAEGISDFSAGESATQGEEKSLFKKLWKRYLALPTTYRYAIIFFVLVFSLALIGEEEIVKKPKPRPTKRDTEGRLVRTFDQLSEEKKEFVRKSYKELVEAQQKRDFKKMQDLITKINAVVDEFRDLKAFEVIAKRGIEEEEARERARLAQERQEALRSEVNALEQKGKAIFPKALKDDSFRPELMAVVQDIYGKDPNNRLAQEWTDAIKQKESQEEREKELARQRAFLKERADREFTSVDSIFKEGRFKDALAASEKLLDIGYSEEEYPERVAELQKQIREKLASVIEPMLKEAETQRGESGDLVKANESYLQILKIDPQNEAAIRGLESIRETLHTRARRFYSLAVLAESISDLTEAKDKFTKCYRTAPEDDAYKERCRIKLARFENYSGETK